MTIYRKLHDHVEIRSMTDEFGRVFHKRYPYPGIPHYDIIPGAFFVTAKDEKTVTDFLKNIKSHTSESGQKRLKFQTGVVMRQICRLGVF